MDETVRSRPEDEASGGLQAVIRRLARTALDLVRDARSRGAYPAELPPALRIPEPFCACEPRLEPRPDGGADLTLPGAEPLDHDLMHGLPAHLLRWHLPNPPGHTGPQG